MRRWCPTLLVFAVASSAASTSRALDQLAQAAPQSSAASPAPAGSVDANLEQAKRLFRQGNELRRAGDCQKAVEFFAQSRAIVPSMQNTLNSAICLDQIGRFDEALEMYEEVLTKHGDLLDSESKRAMSPAMATLRRKVGSMEVSANVEGNLIVDGRMRGRLPLLSPVRLLPGLHVVRVIKDGYETFESSIAVKAGESSRVDARLKPLASAGRLRIEDDALSGADLLIDGAPVGKLPWEGTLAPGDHLFWVSRGDIGSAPRKVTVIQGQTVLAPVVAGPLGPELRFVAEPAAAQLYVDGVLLGKGTWRGRLPLGSHSVDVRESGYFPQTRAVVIDTATRSDVRVVLKPDPSHPRWGVRAPAGRFTLEGIGGATLSGSLGSSPESYCSDSKCPERPVPYGFLVGIRAGYELAFGLGFELGGAYASITSKLTRQVDETFATPEVTSRYELHDMLRVRGPIAFAGATWRRALGNTFEAQARLDVGVWFTSFSNTVSGTAKSGGVTRDVAVAGSGTVGHGAAVFMMPGLDVYARFGQWRAGIGLLMPVILTDGPALDTGSTRVRSQGCVPTANRDSIDCSPDEAFTRGEKAYGRFIMFVPMVSAGYLF